MMDEPTSPDTASQPQNVSVETQTSPTSTEHPPGNVANAGQLTDESTGQPGPVARGIKIGSQRPLAPIGRAKGQPKPSPSSQPQMRPVKTSPVPNIRQQLSPELELEVAAAFGDLTLDEALTTPKGIGNELEPDSRKIGRVAAVHEGEVFIDLGGRNQGVLSALQFAEPPTVDQNIEVVIRGMDAEDGLYRLSLPGGTIDVGDWSEIRAGELVEVRITGHNKGGLECEVNKLRGFIPASQVSTYRVEDLSQFVGQSMVCLINDANPERRNLVLSRRAVMEREKADAREKLLEELAEGQVREGTVRSLQDFGAFIDLGGVDGLLHVSQLGWHRVKHPSEMLTVGQSIKVLVRKIDPESKKISLSFRDLTENPWSHATTRYPETSIVRGKVTRVMDFGAFVELEPGIEGMVHISELSHTRVFRIRDFVKEGEEVEVKVLSIDPEQQRMSLSIKAAQARHEPVKSSEPELPEDEEAPAPQPKRTGPLKGGVERKGHPSVGGQFGLKW
jgi:small subunit ribosomal protein S1